MKRFLLFAYSDYYPSGGWLDLAGDFNTAASAVVEGMKKCAEGECDRYQVVDTESKKIVAGERAGWCPNC